VDGKMKIEQQIGVVLDVIHDIVERDETKDEKVAKIMKMLEGNDRLFDAFSEFISWFKMVEEEAGE
jgi:hypothetical protein